MTIPVKKTRVDGVEQTYHEKTGDVATGSGAPYIPGPYQTAKTFAELRVGEPYMCPSYEDRMTNVVTAVNAIPGFYAGHAGTEEFPCRCCMSPPADRPNYLFMVGGAESPTAGHWAQKSARGGSYASWSVEDPAGVLVRFRLPRNFGRVHA
jgi:hypothetical protein